MVTEETVKEWLELRNKGISEETLKNLTNNKEEDESNE